MLPGAEGERAKWYIKKDRYHLPGRKDERREWKVRVMGERK